VNFDTSKEKTKRGTPATVKHSGEHVVRIHYPFSIPSLPHFIGGFQEEPVYSNVKKLLSTNKQWSSFIKHSKTSFWIFSRR
jgi:hypothetical protein